MTNLILLKKAQRVLDWNQTDEWPELLTPLEIATLENTDINGCVNRYEESILLGVLTQAIESGKLYAGVVSQKEGFMAGLPSGRASLAAIMAEAARTPEVITIQRVSRPEYLAWADRPKPSVYIADWLNLKDTVVTAKVQDETTPAPTKPNEIKNDSPMRVAVRSAIVELQKKGENPTPSQVTTYLMDKKDTTNLVKEVIGREIHLKDGTKLDAKKISRIYKSLMKDDR